MTGSPARAVFARWGGMTGSPARAVFARWGGMTGSPARVVFACGVGWTAAKTVTSDWLSTCTVVQVVGEDCSPGCYVQDEVGRRLGSPQGRSTPADPNIIKWRGPVSNIRKFSLMFDLRIFEPAKMRLMSQRTILFNPLVLFGNRLIVSCHPCHSDCRLPTRIFLKTS
jgi:hypothetical protein